jgi:DNA-binding CsgD family transcriptional regulator
MTSLVVSSRDQRALRTLLEAEPVPGSPIPGSDVLEAVAELVRCDVVGASLGDSTGFLVDSRVLPHRGYCDFDPQVCDGPLELGLVHVSRIPEEAEELARWGASDELWLGFRNGADHVAQMALTRFRGTFSDRDKAMLRMIAPALRRLMRERPTPQLPHSLTLQERRVLMHVAAGRSNADIADHLYIAESTVRKHLEHSFRKLGVTSRLAAVAALQGRDEPGLDLRERISRYA